MSKLVNKLISELESLPGVGYKSATRLAYFYLNKPVDELEAYSKLLTDVALKVQRCGDCGDFSDEEVCSICLDKERDGTKLLVVEEPLDVISIEEKGVFNGFYFVLGGLISPLKAIGPEKLAIKQLQVRAAKLVQEFSELEVIYAFTPCLEADATIAYLNDIFDESGESIKFSSLARGIPTGADIDYADKQTFLSALDNRRGV